MSKQVKCINCIEFSKTTCKDFNRHSRICNMTCKGHGIEHKQYCKNYESLIKGNNGKKVYCTSHNCDNESCDYHIKHAHNDESRSFADLSESDFCPVDTFKKPPAPEIPKTPETNKVNDTVKEMFKFAQWLQDKFPDMNGESLVEEYYKLDHNKLENEATAIAEYNKKKLEYYSQVEEWAKRL